MNGKDFEKLLFDLKITKKDASEMLKISRRALYDWLDLEDFPPKIAQRVNSCFAKEIENLNKNSCEKDYFNIIIESKTNEIISLKETIEIQKKLILNLEEQVKLLKNGDATTALDAAT